MITFIENFLKSFFENTTIVSSIENDEVFSYKFTSHKFLSPDKTALDLSFVVDRDQLTLTVVFGEADPISYYSNSIDDNFISNLNNEYEHFKDEPIEVEITINKKKVKDTITIYDLPTFASTIEKSSISQAFVIFGRAISNENFIIFEVLNLDKAFNTSTIFFTPIGDKVQQTLQLNRMKILESAKSLSYFSNPSTFTVIPDDFYLLNSSVQYDKFCLLLNYYAAVLSIVFLFDITTLAENNLEFKINGYKSLQGNVALIPIIEIQNYYKIYDWVYNSGNINDKIGLARNIISLHFANSGKLELKGEPFQSIQSSYKVYEKQNIKQYIEIRNKITDQLLDFNNRANKVIETFASGFQKSSLALISIYISTIVLKVVGKAENIFTFDFTVLSIFFVACGYIYYRVSKWEVKQQKQRFVDSYTNMKERYTDLLDHNDINRILNEDKEYHADVNFIEDKLKKYSIMWKFLLVALLIISILLHILYAQSFQIDKIICSPTC